MSRAVLLVVLGACSRAGGPEGITPHIPMIGEWELDTNGLLPDQPHGWDGLTVSEQTWPGVCMGEGAAGQALSAVQGFRFEADGDVVWIVDALVACDEEGEERRFHGELSYARYELVGQNEEAYPDGSLVLRDVYAIEDERAAPLQTWLGDTAAQPTLGPEWTVEDELQGYVQVRDDVHSWLMKQEPVDLSDE